MRAHVQSCAACRADESVLRVLWREMNVLPTVDTPLFFRDNVIARIEREETERGGAARRGSFWQMLLPQLGRVALGTALTGGCVAAVAYTLLLPTLVPNNGPTAFPAAAATRAAAPLAVLLPDSAEPGEAAAEAAEVPHLRIERVTTLLPGDGPVYDLSFWLENASQGTVRFRLLGDKESYRFALRGDTHEKLRVPMEAAQGRDTIALVVSWVADGEAHTRYLLIPVPRQDRASAAERQSFGLPEATVLDTARAIAGRYGVPITLEDIPEDGSRVAVTAVDETAMQTLRRHFKNRTDLRLSLSRAGILITGANE